MSKFTEKIRTHLTSSGGILAGLLISGAGYLLVPNADLRTVVERIIPFWSDTYKAKAVAKPHLAWATGQCLSKVEKPIEQIHQLFAEARNQSRGFAEEALGWDSKMAVVSDYFQQTNRHPTFLKQKFEERVISEAVLLSAIERGIEQYHQVTASVEGEMLVRLRSDAADFKDCPIANAADTFALHALFQNAISQSQAATGIELQANVAREIATFILSEVATQVGVQLGVSSGILGAGAATGWTNFGISMIVGVAVDQMVTAAYDSYADPKGHLASQINSRLDEIERLVIEGTGEETGLRGQLQRYARERSALRESVVLQLLQTEHGRSL